MPTTIPTGSVITEAMITDWMSRFGRTRSESIGDLDNIENGIEELPGVVSTVSTYAALVTAYHAAIQKRGTRGRPSTLAAVVAAAVATVAAIFSSLTATGLITSYTRVIAPTIQATSTAALAIQSAGGISASSTIQTIGNVLLGGQVSSTSLIASATGTIGYLGLGNQQTHSFNNAILSIKHTPSQAEAATLDYIQMVNTSSTLDMAISFLDDTETNSILRISAFGREAPFNPDFGFSPANMAFFETVSGTVMLAGDGIAVFNAPGVFRPITGLGFGNNDNIDPFNATASTTISNGNMASASLDFPNSAAAGTQDLTITVMGAADGDECQIGVPNALASRASEAFTCFVSAANTITVRRTCVVAGCGDPGAATVKAGFFARS